MKVLTQKQVKLLHTEVIDDHQPGPILRDFQTFLDFVEPEGVKAAGKYNLLPIDSIAELDRRLSRPLCLELKRPQLRSHPYLQGLHLLLRSSGLGMVTGTGDKSRLVVDPAVLERWHALNPTEQYFTLLEAWLLKGRAEMIGEQGRRDNFLGDCLQALHEVPVKGKCYREKRPEDIYLLGIGRRFCHLALMDLFGLMAIEHPPAPIRSWYPAGLKHLPFGDGVFTLFKDALFSFWRDRKGEDFQSTEPAPFGRFQRLFQPYFPEWRNNLVFPSAESRNGLFIFRVALAKCWRRIAIPADSTLDDLVYAILGSVKFDYDHLYEFTYRDRFGARASVRHPDMEEGPWTDQVRIGDLPVSPGQSLTLVYDFGDSWEFDVKLEAIEPGRPRGKRPRILEKHGSSPKQYPDWD